MTTEIRLKILLNLFFLRIREIKYNESFVNEKELYPGDYIIEIAKKILTKSKLKF